MQYLKIRDWEDHQSYRKGRGLPPWLKLHRALLRSPKWIAMSDLEKGQLVSLWMLAADYNGRIPCDNKLVARLAMLDSSIVLDRFIEAGWLEIVPGDMLATTWRQAGSTETEEEAEVEAYTEVEG